MLTRSVDKIIIHCSGGNFGDVPYIDEMHRNEKGFKSIGYHFLILNGKRNYETAYKEEDDGVIEVGRPLCYRGAHAAGDNYNSIAICCIGRGDLTPRQEQRLVRLVRALQRGFEYGRFNGAGKLVQRHGVTPTHLRVLGHYETMSGMLQRKGCPGFDMREFRDTYDLWKYGAPVEQRFREIL